MRYISKTCLPVVFVHFLFLIVLAFAGTALHLFRFDLQTIQLAPWDPSWYRHIAQDGYYYKPNEQSSVAFFPLFPLIWRLLCLDEWGVCLVNFGLLLLSLLILVYEYKLHFKETLLVCSSFGLFYCWLPFSESVFLITSIMLLIGYKRNNHWLTVVGLFLASLSRSAAVVFIPAVVLVAGLQFIYSKDSIGKQVGKVVLFLAACGVAVFVVALIQWKDTGEWFVFSKAHQAWNKEFRLPQLPIKTWDNFKMLFFDASAMIVGLLCGVTLLGLLIKKMYKSISVHNDLNFSLAYLFFVTVVSLLFGVQGENTTYINSLNRYIFGTGFFLILTIYHLRDREFSSTILLLIILITVVGLVITGYFGNPYNAEQILSARFDAIGIIAAFILFYLLKIERLNTVLFIGVYIIQSILQLHFFELYLKRNWVG